MLWENIKKKIKILVKDDDYETIKIKIFAEFADDIRLNIITVAVVQPCFIIAHGCHSVGTTYMIYLLLYTYYFIALPRYCCIGISRTTTVKYMHILIDSEIIFVYFRLVIC